MSKNISDEIFDQLPEEYSYDGENGRLFFGDMFISNFIPVVFRVYREKILPTNEETLWIELMAYVSDGYTGKVKIRYEELENFSYQQSVDIHCYQVNSTKVKRYLSNLIRYQISQKEEERVFVLTQLGYFSIGAIHGYNAGSEIIGEEEFGVQVCIAETLKEYHLEGTAEETEVKNRIYNMIHLNERITPIVFSYFVLSLLRQPFYEANVPIKFCLFLLGENQSYKTTIATNYCCLYDRKTDLERHVHNLTGTEAWLMHLLNQEKDMVTIIDDLNKSDSHAQERRQEAVISSLIRMAANNVGKETMRKQDSIQSCVLFTGEYALKNTSTNNRLILLELNKDDFLKEKLHEIQQNPEYLSAFARDFIRWVLKNYEGVVSKIQELYKAYRIMRNQTEVYQERLSTNAAVLIIAYGIFLEYCRYKEWSMEYDFRTFQSCVENAVQEQIEILELENKEPPNYAVCLFEQVHLHEEEIGNVREIKVYWRRKLYEDIKKELIYIPGSVIKEFLEEEYPDISVYEVVNQFQLLGLLETDNNKNGCRTKKLAGKRCYVIKYGEWGNYVKDFREEE